MSDALADRAKPSGRRENEDALEQMYNAVSSRLQQHEQAILKRLDLLEFELKKHRQSDSFANLTRPFTEDGRADSKKQSKTRQSTSRARECHSDPPAAPAASSTSIRFEEHRQADSQEVVRAPVNTPASVGAPDPAENPGENNVLSLFSDFKATRTGSKWGQEAFPPLRKSRRTAQFLRSWQFNFIVSLLIVSNSFIIGFQTNHSTGEEFAGAFDRPSRAVNINFPSWTNQLFAGLFFVELLFRLFVERSDFFFGGSSRWNLFDLFLVMSTVLELIAETRNITFARALRLLRIVHVLQVIRVFKVFDVLRYMLFSILNSMFSVLWVIILMSLLLYVYGNFVISIVGNHVDEVMRGEHPHLGSQEDRSQHLAVLDEMFGTISRSILYLFAAVTGGRDWLNLFWVMVKIHWTFALSFLVFYVFIALGVLNIVTGIFVERATELTAFDKEITIMSKIDNMERLVKNLQEFFHETDVDQDGMVTWEEFRKKLRNKDVIAYLQTLGIDVHDALRVFQLLDRRGDGEVAIRDFVEGCIHLKGTAQSMDVCMLSQDLRRVGNMLAVFMHYTEEQLSALRGQEVHSLGTRLRNFADRSAAHRSYHHISHEFRWENMDHNTSGHRNEEDDSPLGTRMAEAQSHFWQTSLVAADDSDNEFLMIKGSL